MEYKMKNIIILTLVSLLIASTFFTDSQASNLPRSKEATLIESVSSAELLIRAAGIGYWEKGKPYPKYKKMEGYLLKDAEIDGRKSAVYFVLYGGTDPLLSNELEKNAFIPHQESFFKIESISKYIAWESGEFTKRNKKMIVKKKKYELHIEKSYKVNKQLIMAELEKLGVLAKRVDITEILGMPFVTVIPSVKKGENPIDLLQSNSDLSHAAKVIESHLTAKQYDVVDPKQQLDLSALSDAQQSLKEVEDDLSYQLALSIGCDVYLTYEVNIEDCSHNTKKAIVNVRAYETTTARLLGTETGYSPASNISTKVLIENAVNDAIDKVLNRITNYWKEDLERGLQYKLIVSIATNFDADQAEEIAFVFSDILREVTKNKKFKENIVTGQTLDYLLWCDPDEFAQSTNLYRTIKKKFGDNFDEGTLRKVNINRKLVLLKVDYE